MKLLRRQFLHSRQRPPCSRQRGGSAEKRINPKQSELLQARLAISAFLRGLSLPASTLRSAPRDGFSRVEAMLEGVLISLRGSRRGLRSCSPLPSFPELMMPTTPWAPEWICTCRTVRRLPTCSQVASASPNRAARCAGAFRSRQGRNARVAGHLVYRRARFPTRHDATSRM